MNTSLFYFLATVEVPYQKEDVPTPLLGGNLYGNIDIPKQRSIFPKADIRESYSTEATTCLDSTGEQTCSKTKDKVQLNTREIFALPN